MKLSNEFENVWANLMSRKAIPSLDECLGELLQEEQCCLLKATMEQKGSAASHLDVAYSTQAKPRDKKKSNTTKDFEHIASQYKKQKGVITAKKPGIFFLNVDVDHKTRQPMLFIFPLKLLLAMLSLSCVLSLPSQNHPFYRRNGSSND